MVIAILTFSLAVAVLIAAREQRRGRTLERLLQRVLSEVPTDVEESYVVDHHQHNHGFVIGGCRGPDAQRLAEAQAHAREQTRVSEQQADVARALAEQLREVADQQSALEIDRREIAAQRWQQPLIAETIALSMELMLCSLPLVLVLMLLGRRSPEESVAAAELSEVLLDDLASGRPRLLVAHASNSDTVEPQALPPPES